MPIPIHKTLSQLAAPLAAIGQRRGWILSGSREWGLDELASGLSGESFSSERCLLIAGESLFGCVPAAAGEYLGSEYDVLIVDAWTHSRVNDWLAAAGTLRAGGALVVLCPPLSDWPGQFARLNGLEGRSRFIARLAQRLPLEDGVVLLQEGRGDTLADQCAALARSLGLAGEGEATQSGKHWRPAMPTRAQAATVQAIIKAATGRRWRPLVIRADRGRGKTAALGLAAAELLQAGFGDIWISSVNVQAVAAAFQHAAKLLGLPLPATNPLPSLKYGECELRYRPVAELLESGENTELLLVDEAAMIAVPTLEKLLQRYPRLVFATTVHGYEGSGRGFDIRFRKILDRERPQWRRQGLDEPVRWAASDPLEQALNDLFLLDAEPYGPEAQASANPADEVRIRLLDLDSLRDDEGLLRRVFGLLVQAHYQTTPQDLVNLLDMPSTLFVAERSVGELLGVCLCLPEGGFSEELAEEVVEGRRRPPGSLAAQRLATISDDAEFVAAVSLRIVRIAVIESARRGGIGQRLCQAVISHAAATDMAYVSSSFAADEDVAAFWNRAGFQTQYLGHRRDASSGAYSLLVANAIAPAFAETLTKRHRLFVSDLVETVAQSHPAISASLLAELVAQGACGQFAEQNAEARFRRDARVAQRYCDQAITFEQALPSLRRLCLRDDVRQLPRWQLAVACFLLQQSWARLAAESGLTGRQAVEDALRTFFATLLAQAAVAEIERGNSN